MCTDVGGTIYAKHGVAGEPLLSCASSDHSASALRVMFVFTVLALALRNPLDMVEAADYFLHFQSTKWQSVEAAVMLSSLTVSSPISKRAIEA